MTFARTRTASLAALTFAALVCLSLTASAHASVQMIEVLHEKFEGYTHSGVLQGLPTGSAPWLAARFEVHDDGTILQDVGVRNSGSGNYVGQVEDDAGLVLKLDFSSFGLSAGDTWSVEFLWYTVLAETNDRFTVAYYEGNDLGNPGGAYDWFNDPALGNGDLTDTNSDGSAGNTWYEANWTELLRSTNNGAPLAFSQSGLSVPVGGTVYLAFWMDNGEKDFGKFDKIWIKGFKEENGEEGENPVPEPSQMVVFALLFGMGAVCMRRRFSEEREECMS